MARYITTTLPYVNADPHIGFAVEPLQADVLARAARLSGEEVFFNTGVDEHGQKLADAAAKAGQTPQEYADHFAGEFQKLAPVLGLSEHVFIRTTDEKHILAAQEMWRRCEAKGDIYKKEYEGLYCVGCEEFKTEKELVDGKCPIHLKEPIVLKEENYFFKLSKYEKPLLEYLKNEYGTLPDWRRQELLTFVEGGLIDLSISREKAKLSWGIPVPGDDAQVMYVWFDALTNYISTLGWPEDKEGKFRKFWQEGKTIQLAGKDQTRFQSVVFQAMLMSADIKNTDVIFYHGFINLDGHKISKSIGNVISPYELVEKYGTEATRYLLLRHVNPFDDTNITWALLDEWYTANLVNGIGNLASRIMKLAETHLDTAYEAEKSEGYNEPKLDQFEFQALFDDIFADMTALDERITREEPFKLIKTNSEAGKAAIALLREDLFKFASRLRPFMPETAQTIMGAVQENKKPENIFPRLL